ncbi:MAG: hypothetical protein AAGG50_08190 [Bacteroidota bacterium]
MRMSSFRLCVLLTMAFGLGSLPVLAQEAIAWLTLATGDVEVRRAATTTWAPADAADTDLFEGDAVRTGRLSRAIVLLANAERVMMSGEETYEVALQATPDAEAEMGKTVASLARGAWNRIVGRSDAMATGAARATDDAPPVLERLRFGYVLSPTPTVRWLAAQPAASYRVRLSNDTAADPCFAEPSPDATVWARAGLTDTTLAYPTDEAALTPGAHYYVEVHRASPDGALEDGEWGCFTVATDSARAAFEALERGLREQYPPADFGEERSEGEASEGGESADVTALLLYAAVLLDQQYYTDTLRVLDAVEAGQPGNAAAERLRRFVYEEAGPPALLAAPAE